MWRMAGAAGAWLSLRTFALCSKTEQILWEIFCENVDQTQLKGLSNIIKKLLHIAWNGMKKLESATNEITSNFGP